ncbi:Acetolactate synthase large subunit [Rubellimicrobium mesophilum DSM 19309]|uniref:Acetolactate synthase large subunit n=1 Tax=Rubellimicrobium mesophilum DSM 19309 TaxID=442562 RepID=A0A017HJE2_9RHOB|nr:Acetolactate synthase large subunit [Rubellimicrobium mesophilum DSM 19309]
MDGTTQITREMTGARMVVQALKDQGVDTVFGYPGGAVLPIYDEIFQQNDIHHILVRHEQGAVHAAEGYARSTGKVGVALVTSGPGATNAVTGLTDALMDSIPIVVLTGQVPTFMIGSDAFQEADTVGITRPCTKANWLVRDTDRLAQTLHEAFHVARSGRPGPVLVDIPQGRPVRHRHLRAARGAQVPLPAQAPARSRHDRGHRRRHGDRRAPGPLHRRGRRQFRPGGDEAPARVGRGHELPDHLDADGPRRLSGLQAELARDARDARPLRGQHGDARLRPDAQRRRPLRRPHHRPPRRLLAGLAQGPHRHRPLLDQQGRPR